MSLIDQDGADAAALMRELGITSTTGSIGIGRDEWFIYIWENRKKPPLIRWKWRPVRYYIGGGMPQAWSVA